MNGQEAMTQRAASLLDVDPLLSQVLGTRVAARVGHDLVLPVLALNRGSWNPPERDAKVICFVVLEGLLLRAGGPGVPPVRGPTDLVDPWGSGPWTAAVPVRMAVLGSEFASATRRWPAARDRMRARLASQDQRAGALAGVATFADGRERVLALLWQLAARWGRRGERGLVLELALDAGTLARLTDLNVVAVDDAVASLRALGRVSRRADGAWLLARPVDAGDDPPGLKARRERLRAQVAEQLATAREAGLDCLAICERIEAHLRASLPPSTAGRA
jgi:hypothetical protein